MRRIKLFSAVYILYLVLTLFSIAVITAISSRAVWNMHIRQTEGNLLAQARLVHDGVGELVIRYDKNRLQALGDSLAILSGGARFTIIDTGGLVLCDTEEDPDVMDNHLDRPEFMAALNNDTDVEIRYSRTLRLNMMYVAIPVLSEGKVSGALRISVPVTTMKMALVNIRFTIFLTGILIALFMALVSWFFAKRIVRPLESMQHGATRFAKGELEFRLPVSGTEEVSSLAESLNKMAGDLHLRIKTINQQQEEQKAVFASMVEGVLAVDNHQHIIAINRAAFSLLNIAQSDVKNKSLLEVIRNSSLQIFLQNALESDEPLEEEIQVEGEGERRYLQVHGTSLRGEGKNSIGALVVLNDITRLKKLESVRQDFVSNVSHELKTPIASIKAAAETLLDGAVEDPDSAKKFLQMINKNSDRLNRIIEDLLSLSRIEQGSGKIHLDMEFLSLNSIIRQAVNTCEIKAKHKNISITANLGRELKMALNPQLLEQAIVNLIDNAIKYSESRTNVTIELLDNGEEYQIQVKDQGPGITSDHIERLFERFYRVDKARSRKIGGTGLGLSIVKHIVQVHGGRACVKSEPGVGSVFSIHLPRPKSS